MTPLDKEYITAQHTQDGAVFYDTFLNSTIFIAVADGPVPEQIKRVGSNETMTPIIIGANGKKHMMLFDTKEKLALWAKRQVGFVAMPGHTVVEMAVEGITGTDLHWVLNAGTDYEKLFVPDEIKLLKPRKSSWTGSSVRFSGSMARHKTLVCLGNCAGKRSPFRRRNACIPKPLLHRDDDAT